MGLIAAGGRSERFGSPKALHPIDGVPMARSVYRALAAVIRDVRVGLAHATDTSPLDDVPVLVDAPAGVGPAGSLRAALRSGEADWVVLAACDMPGIREADVRALLDHRRPEVDAVVAVDDEGATHPLLACYSVHSLTALDALLASGRRSMRAFVERIPHEAVPMSRRTVWNVNRPVDLAPPGGPGEADAGGGRGA